MKESEESMIAAHQAGMAYWRRNKPQASTDKLAFVARSCGWPGELETAWMAGYLGAKQRETVGE